MSGTKRVIANGSDLMVFVVTGTTQVPIVRPIANQKKATLTIEAEDRAVVSKNRGRWKAAAAGGMGWSASCECDLSDPSDTNANEVDFYELQTAMLSRANVSIIVAFVQALDGAAEIDTTRPQWTGVAKVKFPIEGSQNENMSTTYEFTGEDELTPVAGVPTT